MFIVHNELEDGWMWVTNVRTEEQGLIVEDLVEEVVSVLTVKCTLMECKRIFLMHKWYLLGARGGSTRGKSVSICSANSIFLSYYKYRSFISAHCSIFCAAGITGRSPSRRPTTYWWQVRSSYLDRKTVINRLYVSILIKCCVKLQLHANTLLFLYCVSSTSWPSVQFPCPAVRQHTRGLLFVFSYQWKHPKV